MEFLALREAAVLAGSALGAYTDAKGGIIPDKITYPMVALGVLLAIYELDLLAFVFAGVVFAAGYALYYAGKIGGGDVKLLSGIALLMPLFHGSVFVLSVIFVAAVLSVLWLAAYYVTGYARRGINLRENREGIIKAGILGVFVCAYFWLILGYGLAPISYVFALGVPIVAALAFLAFERGIRREFFLEKVSLENLEEDDIIALDFMDRKTSAKVGFGLKGVIGEKEKKKLAQLKLGEVPVYRNLPRFAPFVFLGVLVVLLKPEIAGIIFF